MAADSSTPMVEQSTKIGGQLGLAGGYAAGAEVDLLEVLAGRDDREHDVRAGEVGDALDDLGAEPAQRLGLGGGAVPDA